MYSLLMSGGEDAWDHKTYDFDRSRFLEYTDVSIAERFKSLDDNAIAELKALPALFAYEKPERRSARIGSIIEIERHQKILKVKFSFDDRFDPIEPDTFQKQLATLDIDSKFEIHRNHWAIKDVDLPSVLTGLGLRISDSQERLSRATFSRQTILRACKMHKTLSHADFDTFILELGVDGINAGRDRGGRQARSVALAEFAVNNSDLLTASGSTVALEIILNAARIDAGYPEGVLYEVDDATRQQFWAGLTNDGYSYKNGKLQVASGDTLSLSRPDKPLPHKSFTQILKEKAAAVKPLPQPSSISGKPKVFIVHGRDEATKTDVARFVERLDLEAVILHELPNLGRSLANKFMEVAAEAAFAVVLMTPDDFGGIVGGAPNARARQNVIFELGFFIGRLGADKVCALVSGNVERPSDFEAIVYLAYGPHTTWRPDLARELRAAGIKFDPHKVF